MWASERSQQRHGASLTEASENDPTGIDPIYNDFVLDEVTDHADRLEHPILIFCCVEAKGIDIEPAGIGDPPTY